MEGDAGPVVAALVERLKNTGKRRQPDAATAKKIKGKKPEAVNYEDGTAVDPRRAAHHLEDALPKDDRILVFDGGHAAMVCSQVLTSPSAENWGSGLDFGAIGRDWESPWARALRVPANG